MTPGYLVNVVQVEKKRRLRRNHPQVLDCEAKVGTRYFFLSPLPLVRYFEIVLPLRTGPLFSKFF